MNFCEIESINDLCGVLNISESYLNYLLFVKKNKYISFEIPKKNGGVRKISAPSLDLKIIQKRLANAIETNYDFLTVQHGFIKNRSCVTNALNHVGKRFILNIDLKNFFDTIHFGRVRGMFMNKPFNFSNRVATYLANLVCHNGLLPQGAPTSPIISNLICYDMDRRLDRLAKKNHCNYSRYADDITFSSNSEKFPEEIATYFLGNVILSSKLLNIISGGYTLGFKVNSAKTKLSRHMQRQEVTGIVVNKKLNLNKKYIKDLRAMLHSIEANGFVSTLSRYFGTITNEKTAKSRLFNLLYGKLNYLKMVRGSNDKLFLKYAKQFNFIFDCEIFNVDIFQDLEKYVTERCFVLQSEQEDSQGTAFLTMRSQLYTSTHVLLNKTTYNNFIYEEDSPMFKSQFPINYFSEVIPFFYLKSPSSKDFFPYTIDEINYKSDILRVDGIKCGAKNFKVATKSPQIGQTVYLVGYPDFYSFNTNSICIIETKIIGRSTFLGRSFLTTMDSPKHGMSGGPVLNENREVVGIVYAGADLENDYQSNNVGFISLV